MSNYFIMLMVNACGCLSAYMYKMKYIIWDDVHALMFCLRNRLKGRNEWRPSVKLMYLKKPSWQCWNSRRRYYDKTHFPARRHPLPGVVGTSSNVVRTFCKLKIIVIIYIWRLIPPLSRADFIIIIISLCH